MPLAKLGTCPLDNKSIFIFGGMSADFEPCSICYKLDLTMATFKKKMPMRYDRVFDGGAGAYKSSNKSIYVLNGAINDAECEKYTPLKDQWELIPSFKIVSG